MKPKTPPPEASDPHLAQARQVTLFVYVMHALASTTAVTFFVAIFVNYSRRDRVAGTLYQSHFDWQIRTFWWCLAYSIVGCALAIWGLVRASGDWRTGGGAWLIFIGLLILLINLCWHLYRVIRGLMRWSDRQAF
ncbi:MAG TPA: hypothetical protein VMF52_06380 [Steroidobacteraceae bacterium]|nr:hypothetical protein [Steroidobacteraceae bacterium]